MKNILLYAALPFAALCLGAVLFLTQEKSESLVPKNAVFEINYRDQSSNSLSSQQRMDGYLNYFATLVLNVDNVIDKKIHYSALLEISSFDAKPALDENLDTLHFSFVQADDGLIKTVVLEKGASDAKYSLVLNILSNLSHKLYGSDGKIVRQELFEGESIAEYSESTAIFSSKKVSFTYLNDKEWKVEGGGFIELEDDFYSRIENNFKKEANLHDQSSQKRSVSFIMTQIFNTDLADTVKKDIEYGEADVLAGKLLKKRFKLEEMKNLIWPLDPVNIKKSFMAPGSDGQPWYEYMAYYYVNKDKRDELALAFDAYPEKRGDIVLVLASIGDEDAQERMVNLLDAQGDLEKNDFLRYGVYLEEPNENTIESYKEYSNSAQEYSDTAQKILASMYHKYSDSNEYESDVEELVSTLSSATITDQRHRYSVLGNLGYDLVADELIDDLKSTDEDEERLAIDSLRFNEGEDAMLILQAKARSSNTSVRLSALESLRDDNFDDAFEFYEERMDNEGNKSNRIQLLKNIYSIRNINPEFKELILKESIDCAYQEICSTAKKMLEEF